METYKFLNNLLNELSILNFRETFLKGSIKLAMYWAKVDLEWSMRASETVMGYMWPSNMYPRQKSLSMAR